MNFIDQTVLIKIKTYPLRAAKTLMRKGMGHTAVSTISLVSDPLDLATWSQIELLKFFNFQQGSQI